jgi:hypothetical protein
LPSSSFELDFVPAPVFPATLSGRAAMLTEEQDAAVMREGATEGRIFCCREGVVFLFSFFVFFSSPQSPLCNLEKKNEKVISFKQPAPQRAPNRNRYNFEISKTLLHMPR